MSTVKLHQLQLPSTSLFQSSTSNITLLESALCSPFFNSDSESIGSTLSCHSCSTFPDLEYMQMESESAVSSVPSISSDRYLLSPTNSDSSDIPLVDLILGISKSEESIILYKHGYEIIEKYGDTIQGELFKAEVITAGKNAAIGSLVNVKKVEKQLFIDQIAIQDGINFCISENIVKEAALLQFFTINAKSNMSRDYIVQFVDFVETDSHLYLITKFIENSMSLKQFIDTYQKLIKNDKLHIKQYLKVIKFIMWQLFTATHWLHSVYNCCHLKLSLDSVVIQNGSPVEQSDGSFKASSKVRVLLTDFGVAECYNNSFKCDKQTLSIDECYMSPQQHNDEIYDARAADQWSLGLIMYECIVGKPLYNADDVIMNENGYGAVTFYNNLRDYLITNNLMKRFNASSSSFSMVKGLILMDANQRMDSFQTLMHPWFGSYYQKYKKTLENEFVADKKLSEKQMINMSNFPFYTLD